MLRPAARTYPCSNGRVWWWPGVPGTSPPRKSAASSASARSDAEPPPLPTSVAQNDVKTPVGLDDVAQFVVIETERCVSKSGRHLIRMNGAQLAVICLSGIGILVDHLVPFCAP